MDVNWQSDMLIEILLKLPVKSIVRFKCVAKSWCHLFQSPGFISQHLSVSKKNKQHLVVYYRDRNNDNIVMRLFLDQALVSYRDDLPRQVLPSHFSSLRSFEFCVDNGLFCLHDPGNSVLALWNPATREFKILPECTQKNIPPRVKTDRHAFGFGFDPLSNDYKLIFMWDCFPSEYEQEAREHAVYTMSTDSWRVFKEEEVEFFEDCFVCDNFNNACVNGVYYWQTFKSGVVDFKVLAFNLSTEVFHLIDSPLSETCGQLLPLHDRIAIWDTHLYPDVKISNEVWVLNDDQGHWTKVLKIEPALEAYKMFGFWKNGKVLVESIRGQLLLYDLESEEAKELGIQTREGGDFLLVYTYEESLVAI
ncbi:hypothetical protein PTKIN_Ptkin16aG0475600 [Pterospermum kingtungense]